MNNSRLVEILQEYGTIETGMEEGETRPFLKMGVWIIPTGEAGRRLIVQEAVLPLALAELLKLYVESLCPKPSENRTGLRQRIAAWLAGEREMEGAELAHALQELGWQAVGAQVIALEPVKEAEEDLFLDAVNLLEELIGHEEAFVVARGLARIDLLVSGRARKDFDLSAALDMLGTELYLLFRAGVSAEVAELREMNEARSQAEFALMAGKLYRSKESIHLYNRLGTARLLYGIPHSIRDEFVQEVLPHDLQAALTPELRETILTFLAHGQQVAETARALYVHRNTLLYRLERIAELTGYDIRKPLQCWTLWLALTLTRSHSPS